MVATRNSSSGGAGEAGGGVTLDGRSLIVGPKAAEVLRELQVTDAVIVDGKGDLSETEINKEIGEQGEAPVLGNESALRVWQGNLLDLPLYYGPFDQVIVGEDEYKKSDSASEVVGKCAEILSPGGTFLVYGVESSRNALQELVQVRSLALDKHPFVAFEPSTQQQRSLPPNAICLQLPEGYLFQESPVRLKSTVVHGFKRGSKQLGFPTANLHVPTIESQIEGLKSGVYFGWAKVNFKDGSRQDEFGKHPRKVVVNIGERPSFEDGSNITIEVHVMDYEGGEDFYGEEMCVILLGFIRAEMKFDGIDMLIGRIKQDIGIAKKALDEGIHKPFQVDAFINGRKPRYSLKNFEINSKWTTSKKLLGWTLFRIVGRRDNGSMLELMAVCDKQKRCWIDKDTLKRDSNWQPGWFDPPS